LELKQRGDKKMITEKERKNRDELFKLMRENPELPVIPFVDGEIPGDDSGYWLGSWGIACIDDCLFPKNDYCPVMFKSDDDIFGVLERYLSDEAFDTLPESESECRPIYDALPWVKAITVYINLPD